MELIVSVVLSGGSDTRLWATSRKIHLKPLMKLVFCKALIEKTYAHAKALGSKVLIVTNRDYNFRSGDEKERVKVSFYWNLLSAIPHRPLHRQRK